MTEDGMKCFLEGKCFVNVAEGCLLKKGGGVV
jgi:hypothetical protein